MNHQDLQDEQTTTDLEYLDNHISQARYHAEMSETGITVTVSAPCAQCGNDAPIDYDISIFNECEHHCQPCEHAFEMLCED